MILKLFNFDNNLFTNDFFEIQKSNFEQFKIAIGITELHKNHLIIQPVNLMDHYSLILVNNDKIYLLDFGLTHCSDSIKNEYTKIANDSTDKLLEILKDKKVDNKFLEF